MHSTAEPPSGPPTLLLVYTAPTAELLKAKGLLHELTHQAG
jgi:hypothetical protein